MVFGFPLFPPAHQNIGKVSPIIVRWQGFSIQHLSLISPGDYKEILKDCFKSYSGTDLGSSRYSTSCMREMLGLASNPESLSLISYFI